MDSETAEFGNSEFPMGKYRNDPVWAVVDEDPAYCEWFINSVTNYDEFCEKLRKYFKAKYPHGY